MVGLSDHQHHTPIARPMHSAYGAHDGMQSDVWVVGNNITLHRTVTR